MRVAIVGTGLGPDTLTPQGARAIADADLVVGSRRLIETFAAGGQAAGRQIVAASRPEEVIAAIDRSEASRVSVLMSGDVGFYSGAAKVADWLRRDRADVELTLVPGLSTVVALAARVGVPWQDACLVSCHATGADLVAPVRRHRHTIALTGGNVPALAAQLDQAGYGQLAVWAGQDLGTPGETVTATTVGELTGRPWSSLTVLLIENPQWDDRVLAGLPDERFARGSVPMTKAAVRAVAMSRLAVRPADIGYDIGCGTGSVTVELALAAHAGHVYGIDKNPEAAGLTRDNCRAFHIGNATIVQGSAPDATMAQWPAPDVAFVGGSSGSMRQIVAQLVARNPQLRIVITAIAVESAAAAIDALTAAGLTPEVTQVTVANGRAVGGLHLMMGLNPVTIVSGGGHD